jgi:putative transcriptional regulator
MDNANRQEYEDRFLCGLEEVVSHKQGVKQLRAQVVCVPATNPSKIRSDLKISQIEFSEKFGIPLATVKNWEQGRRVPDQPASILLHLISKFPDKVAKELARLKSSH